MENIVENFKKVVNRIINNPKRLVCFLVLLVLLLMTLSKLFGMISLRNELMRGWSTTETVKGKFYEMVLDFDKDIITYTYDCKDSDVNETITEYSYKVISENEIKIEGRKETFKIEFNDERNLMTVSPGIITGKEFEFWHNDK